MSLAINNRAHRHVRHLRVLSAIQPRSHSNYNASVYMCETTMMSESIHRAKKASFSRYWFCN